MAPDAAPPRVRRVAGRSVSAAIIAAAKGMDVIMIGASGRGAMLGGRVLEEVVVGAPCHVVIVKAGADAHTHQRIFVPIDGSTASRIAAEFALIYAQAARAELTVGFIHEHRMLAETVDAPVWTTEAPAARRRSMLQASATWPEPRPRAADPSSSAEHPRPAPAQTPAAELERISPAFAAAEIRPKLIHVDYDPARSTLADEILKGNYDLVVLGAENRAITHRMFFGFESQRIVEQVHITTLIVVPKLALVR
jgi:nucleotide-binding universal stress UspA family protein